MLRFRYSPGILKRTPLTYGDGLILLGLAALLYPALRLALHAPEVIRGPEISLSLWALPWYAFLSTGRMAAAYFLSLVFSLVYGYAAAREQRAERVLMPILDVLQSVPILSFLPIALLSFNALMPRTAAVELAAIFLIFTSQAWNMTFSFYQSMRTIPEELKEATAVFRLDPWLRLKTLELPFAAIPLIWNSIMSWSGGWFFLMAAEIFHVGNRDFRLAGLGSYLQVAADAGEIRAILAGLVTLVAIIVLLDQFVWRPLLSWADKFKLEMVQGEEPPRSWFFEALSRSWLLEQFDGRIRRPLGERLDGTLHRLVGGRTDPPGRGSEPHRFRGGYAVLGIAASLAGLYGAYLAAKLLMRLPVSTWGTVGLATGATFLRVSVALGVSLLWTIPVGVLIGTNRRMAEFLQPVVQVIASVPATALLPILVLALLSAPGGLNLIATLLMLLGSQWYLLFNVIAGASAIPQDLLDTTTLLGLSHRDRWRNLILPALFPYIITGSITATGGAWNASIVAEQVIFAGRTYDVLGVGALIAQATGQADYPLLLASTLALIMTVVILNRRFWRRLYRLAEDRYRLE